MKIILKDPAKVEAVIEKITDKFPCHNGLFMKYGVEALREGVSESNPMILNVDWGYNLEYNDIESKMGYYTLNDLPTDADFLNDKEW